MPSDQRLAQVLEALAPHFAVFRTMVDATISDVRDYLVASARTSNGHLQRVSHELGPFGVERLDVAAFASLVAEPEALDRMTRETVEKALNTLTVMVSREDDLFFIDAAKSHGLGRGVSHALAEIGRVFGAVHIVNRVRTGRFRYGDHARSLGSYPFDRWTRAERQLVPPLTVLVDGHDLRATELAEFLDGAVKLILIVRGQAAPAPLVRLITPQTFVMQSTDPDDVAKLLGWNGAGIVAFMPEGAARFHHDPVAGAELWNRLSVTHMPSEEPRKSVGPTTVGQQVEELRQLRALVWRPVVETPSATPAPDTPDTTAARDEPVDPADKLAAWLLSQVDLSNVE